MHRSGKTLMITGLLALFSDCKPADALKTTSGQLGDEIKSAATPAATTADHKSSQAPQSMSLAHSDNPIEASTTSAPCVIRVMDIPKDDVRYTYYDQLLRLAIAKSEATDGPCRIETTEFVTHLRKLRMLQTGKLEVAGNVASAEWEHDLLAIPVPIHQGLHGIRLLVIRKGDEARFAKVRSVRDLQQLRAGVMHDWQVRQVLEVNAIPVELTDHYDSLYAMLTKGRLDYIPLSLFEVQQEVTRHSQASLAIEPTIVLNYPSVDYFFVRPDRKDLFARIQRGLELAIKDGSRDALFDKVCNFPTILQRAALPGRTVIALSNPFQSLSTPVLEHQLFSLRNLMRPQQQ